MILSECFKKLCVALDSIEPVLWLAESDEVKQIEELAIYEIRSKAAAISKVLSRGGHEA